MYIIVIIHFIENCNGMDYTGHMLIIQVNFYDNIV